MAQSETNGVQHIDADDQSKTTIPQAESQAAAAVDSRYLANVSRSTLAIHADDPLNIVTDVAPPVHVSTTFRYPRDPDQLHSIYGRPSDERNPTEHCYSRDTHAWLLTTRSNPHLSSPRPLPDILFWPVGFSRPARLAQP